MELMRQLHDLNQMASRDAAQKSKIKWAIEGDENSKFFHGIINKKRSYLSIRGVFVDGIWCTDPVVDMDSNGSRNEIRRAVWDCGDNKSLGPDGYSFEFFRKYWSFIGPDFCCADYLLDVLHASGFGPKWCRWIRGTFSSSKASVLVNGSPTSEFSFWRGLKQGDPLSPFLF
nr:RNA-directed DNA polymerase, eukaryota [Tanacetum cinerariifolium]